MSNFDWTGPQWKGPKTWRWQGPCNKNNEKLWAQNNKWENRWKWTWRGKWFWMWAWRWKNFVDDSSEK